MKFTPFKDVRSAKSALVGQPLQRAFKVSKADINPEARTVQMALTSDEPILHWVSGRGAAYIILDHGEKAKNPINLERMQSGMALLENHDPDRRLGRIRDGKSDGKVLRATARFSSRPYADEIFREVQEDLEHGDSPGTSAWFSIERLADKVEGYIDEFPVIRAIKWTILEGSIASVEADTRSGIGRSMRRAEADDDEEECYAESCDNEDCLLHGERASRTQPRRRITTMCNARSAAECQTENCSVHTAEQKRAAQMTPEQIIAKRQAEYTGWAEVFADTPEERTTFTQLAREYGRDENKTVEMFKAAIDKAKTEARAAVNTAKPPAGAVTVPGRRTSSLRVFKGEGGDLRAYRFMMGFLANACRGVPGADRFPVIARAYNYAKDHGLLQQQRAAEGQSEGDPEAGGFTVAEEWSPETIALLEDFGVIRRYAKVEPMAAEAKNIRRREGGLQFHAAGEADDVEVEKKKWGGNKLVAKKWLCLANITSELSEDSAVNQADDLAYEMTLAEAQLEDDLGFLADGTGSESAETGFQGVVGVIPKLLSLASNKAHIAGLIIANGAPTKPSQVPLILGDLRMGTLLGDRSALTISISEHSSFRNDTVDLKGRIRRDFIAHSVGNANSDAAKRKAGPIVALATDSWTAVTEDDLNDLMAVLPRFRGIKPVFFTHQAFYFRVMRKILMASGGATPADLAGAGPFQFGGYPVEFCNNLPSAPVA